MRCILTGAAPINPDTLDFLKICFSVPIVECYGQSESSGPCFNTIPKDSFSSGHVGGPLSVCEYWLEDVPEMNYFSRDHVGEVLIRGSVVFDGYFWNPTLTNETIKNGWLHTGDIAKILPSGALKIIDRKKHLFKLS